MKGSDRTAVLSAIEHLSAELISLYERHRCLTDPGLIEHSQYLDGLIVAWCRGEAHS